MKTKYITLAISLIWATLSLAQNTTTYQYNDEGWLKQSSDGVKTQIYTYDALGNRTDYSVVTTNSLPDLSVNSISIPNTNIEQGETLSVSCTINNNGVSDAGQSILKVYLSPSATGTETEVGSKTVVSITVGNSQNANFDINIPLDATIGNMYLVFLIDADFDVPESNENNNKGNEAVIIENNYPIPAPTSFSHTVNTDNSLTLNWTQINDGNTYDYIIYYEADAQVSLNSTNVNAGNVSTYTFYELDQEPMYEFMVVAMDSDGDLGETSDTLEIDLAIYQTHTLNEGWNLIGFYTEPFNLEIEQVFAAIFGQVLQIKTETSFYDSSLPPFLNTLSTIENAKGYWVKLTTAGQFNVRGKSIDLSAVSIQINQGWNLISYPSLTPEDLEVALNSIFDKVIQVKHIYDFYDVSLPPFLNTLEELNGERGYWIKVTEDCVLTY